MYIDWQHPVNWNDAITRDLLAWWLNVPHWRGGDVLRDLTKLNDGDLKNMEPGDWNSGGDRPGNLGGALDFGGTNEYVEAPGGGPNLETPTTQLTISLWCNITSLAAQGYMIAKGMDDTTWQTFRLRMETNGQANFSVQNNGLSEFPSWEHQTAISSGDWHHYVFVLNEMTASGSDVSAFLDGVPETLDFTANGYSASFTQLDMNSAAIGGSLRLGSGHNNEDINNPLVGLVDDVQIWGRALHDAESVEVYQDSRVRHLRMLRRLRRRAVRVPDVGGANPKGPLGLPLHGALRGPI